MAYNYQSLANIAKKVSTYLASKSKNAKIKTSRYNSTIKVVEIDDIIINIEDFLKSLSFPGSVSDLQPAEERSISGTYKAKLVTVNKSVPSAGLNKGDQFFILNGVSMTEWVKVFYNIKTQDRQAIGKDFGEVLSLRWYLSQSLSKGWKKFGFETGSNAALVDYYVIKEVK